MDRFAFPKPRALPAGQWIAHRGLHDAKSPENSMSAFQAALAAGFPIETDLRLSADGQIMIFHDESLNRMTGGLGTVESNLAVNLSRLTLNGTDRQTIPRLAYLLDLVGGRVHLYLEPKVPAPESPSQIDRFGQCLLAELSLYKGSYSLHSFSPPLMRWFYRNAPQITRGLASYRYPSRQQDNDPENRHLSNWQRWQRSHLISVFDCFPDFIAYDIAAMPNIACSLAHRFGIELLAWTATSQDRANQALAANPHAPISKFFFEQFRPSM